jgi:hypothetical protein
LVGGSRWSCPAFGQRGHGKANYTSDRAAKDPAKTTPQKFSPNSHLSSPFIYKEVNINYGKTNQFHNFEKSIFVNENPFENTDGLFLQTLDQQAITA